MREGLPDRPVFLMVLGGGERWVGKRRRRRIRWEPTFDLVHAEWDGKKWWTPLPIADLVAWGWQR